MGLVNPLVHSGNTMGQEKKVRRSVARFSYPKFSNMPFVWYFSTFIDYFFLSYFPPH